MLEESNHQRTSNLRKSISYQKLLSSPLVPQEEYFRKFKELCSNALARDISTDQKSVLKSIRLEPEDILAVQKVVDDEFKDFEDLKPISIFKTLKFDENGSSDLYNLKK